MAENIENIWMTDGVEEVKEFTEEANDQPLELDLFKEDEETPFFKRQMHDTIQKVREYSWKRGEIGGLDWGFDSLNKAFAGLNTGLHMIAAQSNVGKSAFCMQLSWQIIRANRVLDEKHKKKAYVLYFSLDDNVNEILPRFIAIDQKIPINAIRFPKKYQHDETMMQRMDEGYKHLEESESSFGLSDVNDGSSIEHVEATCEKYAFELRKVDPDYQLVVFIDNFHDVTVDSVKFGTDSNSKFDYIADHLSRLCTKLDIPIICTGEFRKLNGNRRPINDDIKETGKIVYEAKAIILAYNEVGIRGQQAGCFWQDDQTGDKMPVFEADIRKNKFGSFKGRTFFEFMPAMSYFKEVPEAGCKHYNQMIRA